MGTRSQLDIFQNFPYDFITLFATVWPDLLETSWDACAGQVVSPQNKLRYLWDPAQDDYTGLLLKNTFRMIIAERQLSLGSPELQGDL